MRIVRLFAAGHALVAGGPRYAQEHQPWPTLTGRPEASPVFGQCLGGSLGLAPGPRPFVSRPSDAGYAFASRMLRGYFQESFSGGPFDYYGHDPAEWRERRFVDLEPPRLRGRFHLPAPEQGAYAGNFVYEVKPGPDGWPAMAWSSHRAPKGGPLTFGTIGTEPGTKGKLRRSLDVSPYLRLSAYEASEAR